MAVQKLIGAVADAIDGNIFFYQRTDTDMLSADDPVVVEVTECNGLLAGFRIGHELGDVYFVPQDGVIGMVPDVVAIGILDGAKGVCGLIIHDPHGVAAVSGFYREEQLDHIIIGQCSSGHTNLCTTVLCQDAGGHILAGAVDESIVFRSAEVLRQPGNQVRLDHKTVILHKRIFQHNAGYQLVSTQDDFAKVIHCIANGDSAALRHPCRGAIVLRSLDTIAGIVCLDIGGNVSERAFTGDCHSRCGTAHIGVEQPGQRLRCFYHIGIRGSVASHREESVGVTGYVKLDVTTLDIIGLSIVGEAVRQQTEDADTCAGGTDLDIGRFEALNDVLRPWEQLAIHDAMVQVDAHDPATDTDAVIACCGCYSFKGCEGIRGTHAGSACCAKRIWHFDLIAVPQFIFPTAELSVRLEELRYFFIELELRVPSFDFVLPLTFGTWSARSRFDEG